MPKKNQISDTDRVFYKLQRDRLWREQNGRCKYCNEKIPRNQATMDHVVPLDKVKYHNFDNCVVACYDCNQEKANQTEWIPDIKSLEPWEQIIEEWKLQIDESIRQFEYLWETNTMGNYNRWKKYWNKKGRWG